MPYQFAAKIVSAFSKSFNEFVVVMMNGLKEDFGIDRSAFFLIDKDDGVWRLKAKLGNDLPDYDCPPSKEEQISIKLVKELVVNHPTPGVGFDLYMIVRDENRRAIGILALDDTTMSRQFNAEELSDFKSLAQTLNDILQQKREYDDLTIRDPLTGLFNLNIFDDVKRDFANVDCIWILDIDHFKLINDKYGHPGGDAVLRHLAKYLKVKLRQGDNIIIRQGGEEFVVVMKGIKPEIALERVNALAKAFKAERIRMPSGDIELTDVTFSVGFYVPKKRETFEESISCADVLLYKAKNSGRNKVVSI